MSIPTAIIAMGGNSISPKGETGTIGYMIQQSLQNKLRDMELDREVVTLVSPSDSGPE